MVGGVPIRYVNLPSEELAKYAAKAIDNDIPVWFGCDAAKFGYGADGIYSDESECSNGLHWDVTVAATLTVDR